MDPLVKGLNAIFLYFSLFCTEFLHRPEIFANLLPSSDTLRGDSSDSVHHLMFYIVASGNGVLIGHF